MNYDKLSLIHFLLNFELHFAIISINNLYRSINNINNAYLLIHFIFVNFITVCFFSFLLLTGRYLDKFSELLYLPGFILVYYDEPI